MLSRQCKASLTSWPHSVSICIIDEVLSAVLISSGDFGGWYKFVSVPSLVDDDSNVDCQGNLNESKEIIGQGMELLL